MNWGLKAWRVHGSVCDDTDQGPRDCSSLIPGFCLQSATRRLSVALAGGAGGLVPAKGLRKQAQCVCTELEHAGASMRPVC